MSHRIQAGHPGYVIFAGIGELRINDRLGRNNGNVEDQLFYVQPWVGNNRELSELPACLACGVLHTSHYLLSGINFF